MVVFEPIQGHWKEFYQSLKLLLGNISVIKIKTVWQKAWIKAKIIDKIDRLTNQTRPYLDNPKLATELYREGFKLIHDANSSKKVEAV